jgi:hypothetical protein
VLITWNVCDKKTMIEYISAIDGGWDGPVWPGTGRHEGGRNEVAKNQKGKLVGGKKRLETLPTDLYKTETILAQGDQP